MIHERIEADNKASPWIGTLPSGWNLKSIKRVVSTPITDGPHETPELSDDGVQFISAEAIKNNRIDFNRRRGFISRELHELYSRKCKPQKNDIFIVKSGATTGNVAYVDVDFEFNIWSPLAVIRCRPGIVSYKFLFYQFQSESFRKQVELSWSFGTQENIGMGVLGRIKVILPLLPEQKLIAAYLDASCEAIDKALTSKQRQLETLDTLRKSIVQRTVTQGLNPQVKMKVVPMDGVGLVPEHWRVKQLRYCCQISYGITLQLETGKTTGVPILTVQNLDIHGDWKFDQEFCIDEELVSEEDILRHGDLLFNWRNGSAKHVGKTAFFNLDGRYTHVSFLLRMRCGKHLTPFYLKSYLGALRMAGFFEGAKDKVNKTFNSTELNRLSVLVPPIKEQEAIVEFVQEKWDEIEKIIKVIEAQIETLTAYRKSLIHECVTGQKRIIEADVTHAQAYV
jgi:type I restriction enzyme S subunit